MDLFASSMKSELMPLIKCVGDARIAITFLEDEDKIVEYCSFDAPDFTRKRTQHFLVRNIKGVVISRGAYDSNGEVHGKVERFYDNGKKKDVEYFTNGKPSLAYEEWYPEGNVKVQVIPLLGARGDIVAERKTFYLNGKIQSLGYLNKTSSREGEWKDYNESGKIIAVRKYHNQELLEGAPGKLDILEKEHTQELGKLMSKWAQGR